MDREQLFQIQNQAHRNPLEIAAAPISDLNNLKNSLSFSSNQKFAEILEKLNINLYFSREYEHLLICLSATNGIINQTFYPIPHPSGIATNKNQLVVASTRNPNRIIEFTPTQRFTKREEDKTILNNQKQMLPSRIKYYPGSYYFHDLVYIGNQLYANSVGQNGVIKINFNKSSIEKPIWQPNLSKSDKKLINQSNYLQINSIAAGKNIKESYFTASAAKPGKYKPGDLEFPVDKTGVIFSGDGLVYATGLTRPHSVRFYQNKIWLNNSGYGSFGYIHNNEFIATNQLPGWTRGLHFVQNYAFVATSRVLPRFAHYAPGIDSNLSKSAIHIIDMNTLQLTASIEFPFGNQIFGIESLEKSISGGFFSLQDINNQEQLKSIYYKSLNR